jgi:hypothetical protein
MDNAMDLRQFQPIVAESRRLDRERKANAERERKAKRKAPKATRILVYTGPSRYTGEPVIAWITLTSKNAKTGDMITLWITADHGAPSKAACGNCAQLDNGCYAQQGTPSMACRSSLRAIRRWQAGADNGTMDGRALTLAQWRLVLGHAILRNAGWGDSSALPAGIVSRLHTAAASVRAYTHDPSQVLARSMLSVESAAAYAAGVAAGHRVAAVVPADTGKVGGMPVPAGAVVCPAISTAGKVGCDRCTLCSGSDRPTAPHVLFPAHGPGWRKADAIARAGWGWNV